MIRTRRTRLQVTPLEERTNPSTFTWDHGGADNNWSTAANWVGDVAPTAADIDTVIVFNTVDSNCVMNIVGMDVAKIDFASGSNITLTLSTALKLEGAGAPVNIQDDFVSTNSIVGPGSLVLTNADATIEENIFPGFLLISAPISGAQGFTKTGTGTLILSTTVGNTYSGTTTVADGVLELRTSTLDLGLSNNIVVGDGVGAAGSAILRLGPNDNFELPGGTTLTINGDGRATVPTGAVDSLTSLNIDGGELSVAGILQIQSGGIVSSDGTAGSKIDGAGELASLGLLSRFDVADGPGTTDLLVSTRLDQVDFPASLVKTGTGTLEFAMTAANTLTGATIIRDGVLLLNSNTTDAALTGNITIGDNIGAVGSAVLRLVNADEIADTAGIRVNADGLLDVTATASETVASLNLNTGSSGGGFAIATGGSFRVLPVGLLDTIDLTGGVLTFNRTGPLVPLGQTVTLIDNLGAGPITGTFAGLPEGGTLTANGQEFSISYVGGTGNDVVLTAINSPPVAGTDTLTTDENVARTIDPLVNDTDPNGDTLFVTAVTQGANGTVTFSPTSVTYTPVANYNGPDSFTYTVSDGNGGTATGTVNVTVNPVNNAPVANADTLTTDENAAGTIDPRVNDTDADGDTLSVTAVTQGANGTVTFSPTSVTYTPAAGFSGPDSFSYTVSDGNGGTATASVAVTVNAVNNPPVAVGDTLTTDENAAGTIDPRTNDSDPDGDTLSVTAVTQGLNGTVTFSPTSVTYTPMIGSSGADSFTYTISDGNGGSATATVSVTVNPVNSAPIAGADTLTTNENEAGTIDPRANDTDVDGDALTVTAVTHGTHGTATFSPTSVTYSPAAGYSGPDSFTYSISDGNGGTATATVSVTVKPVNSLSHALAVSGQLNSAAEVFLPNASGQYAATPAATLAPFAGFTVNVRTAIADVDGDGIADTILVTGPGTPIRVTVISGVDNSTVLVAPFDPFGGDFTGGGFVAAADINHDGKAEFVVTPDEGGGPRVCIFTRNPDGTTTRLANFFGIDDPNFRGGARSALGDVNNDGTADLIVSAGFGGGPRVALFDGATLFATPTRLVPDFFAFPGPNADALRNGVYVAAGDIDGDGFADLIIGAGPGGSPRVFILSGALVSAGNVAGAQAAPIANFFVDNNSSDRGGVRVAAKNADGDAQADLAVGSGEGSPAAVRIYLGANFTGGGEPATFQDLTVFNGNTLPGGVFVG